MEMRRTYLSDSSDEESKYQPKRYHILVLGEEVGKTSFIHRVTQNYFTIYYEKTRTIEIHNPVRIGESEYCFWDLPPHVYDGIKQVDLTLLCFHSMKKETKTFAIEKWRNIQSKMKHLPPAIMVGIRIPVEKEEGVHYIDSMSREGISKLMFTIHKILP